MSVYVDNSQNRFGRMKMAHMIADTPEELHAMADKIGVARHWYQVAGGPNPASFPHYDIAMSKRLLAIQHGAIPLDRRLYVEAMRGVRARIIAEVEFAARWRWGSETHAN